MFEMKSLDICLLPSEKLWLLQWFHQMRDADSQLCFPADNQDGVGVPAQKSSTWAQLKSSQSGEDTVKT